MGSLGGRGVVGRFFRREGCSWWVLQEGGV